MATTTKSSRIVPNAFAEADWHLEGQSPLLMHDDKLLDITHPLARKFKELAAKRGKTIDDAMMLARIEWEAGMYHDDNIGPYMPGTNLKRAITEAATRFNKGAPLKRGLVVTDEKVPLEYDGPRDMEDLWEYGYRDMRGAVNSGRNAGRVMRCRPCFEEWGLTVHVAWDVKECDVDTLESIVVFAQIRGIGDFRPEFGTFQSTFTVTKVGTSE